MVKEYVSYLVEWVSVFSIKVLVLIVVFSFEMCRLVKLLVVNGLLCLSLVFIFEFFEID